MYIVSEAYFHDIWNRVMDILWQTAAVVANGTTRSAWAFKLVFRDEYGCWNVAKRIFMWCQNIFLFSQNKLVFNKMYLHNIKIYFHPIKINVYPKWNSFIIIFFFIQLKYFLLYEFFIWYFSSDHLWSSIFVCSRILVSVYKLNRSQHDVVRKLLRKIRNIRIMCNES